jgi:hypothetical protein
MGEDFLTFNVDVLRSEYLELVARNKVLEEQADEILKFSDISVIDCSENLYIINVYGAKEKIFRKMHANLRTGTDLMKHVFKLMKDKNENDDEDVTVELRNLEITVNAFIHGTKLEEEFKIVGENENSEPYLLVWKIKKSGRYLRCYFKILTSHSIVNAVKLKYQNDIENQKKITHNFVNICRDGVTLLDTKGRIKLMSKKAKEHFFAGSIKILQNAPVEGRFFREIFTSEPPEEINKRIEYNNKVMATGVTESYFKRTHGKNLEFDIFPFYESDSEFIRGIVIFTRTIEKNFEELETINRKLQSLVQLLKNDNGLLKERINELEINQGWLMKKMNEVSGNSKLLHDTVLQLYAYLDIIPYPLAIINVPSLRYEFVNKSFLKFLNRDKRDILGKKDEEILTSDTAFDLSLKIMETLNCVSNVDISIYGNPGIQYGFSSNYNEPTHIIRILNKIGI